MHLLLDTSALTRPSRPREAHLRELLRRLALCSDHLEMALLGWPRRLGDPAQLLEPLPRAALARVHAALPDWDLAKVLMAGDAVLYSPFGVPAPPPRLRRALESCPRVATVPLEPARGLERCARVVAWTRCGAEQALAAGVYPEQLRWIPAPLDGTEPRRRRPCETVSVPGGRYVAMSWPSSPGSTASWVEAARHVAGCKRALRDRRLGPTRLVVLGAPWILQGAASWLAGGSSVLLQGPLGELEHERVIGSAQAFLHTGTEPEAILDTALALRLGVPVLAPYRPELVEIFGDAARYHAPGRRHGLASELAEALVDEDLRRALAQKGIVRARTFSWEGVARQLLDLFAELGAAARERTPPPPRTTHDESWQPVLARR